MHVGNSGPGRLLVIALANLAVATLLMESVRAQVVPPTRESVRARHRNVLDDRPGKDAIVTRQRLFSIPFAIDNPAKPPREIYLFVSGDRGARWSLYQKRPAADRKFDFQAGKDGEYWFAVGTDTVRIRPDRNTRPEKVVIVDTDLPRIDLRVTVLSPGRLSARWYAADDTLSPGTFRLSYRTDASTDWKQIDVILPRDTSPEFDGEVSWMVADSGTVEPTFPARSMISPRT